MGKTASWDVPQVTRLAKSEAYWPCDIPKVIHKAFTKAYPVPWENSKQNPPGLVVCNALHQTWQAGKFPDFIDDVPIKTYQNLHGSFRDFPAFPSFFCVFSPGSMIFSP